ncbi:2-phospho-L-lactate guanylyltransferase [Salinibaculum rarum]|uniref:2-phospho-L-lactate guanylyltransferase n=1 Tax=Salinibaculum rarum TaxID=3058903 RepID=UPI00265EAE1F|nr:2-phospho-L-lactate guanylyltransferase [Salinibaculum sp. KK48]
MEVFVPFDATDPKTRLSDLLDADERSAVARAMLRDVLDALAETPHQPRVLATEDVDCSAPVTVDDRPLTPAVNDALAAVDGPAAVVMADLALVTPDALGRLFEPDAGVVLAPGLGGGTNALLARRPAFRVDYHGFSYRDHVEAATAVGGDVVTVDSFRLAVDVDAPDDLVEVLLHTDGRTAATLHSLGVELAPTESRGAVTRRS